MSMSMIQQTGRRAHLFSERASERMNECQPGRLTLLVMRTQAELLLIAQKRVSDIEPECVCASWLAAD